MSKVRLNQKTNVLNDNIDVNVDIKLKFNYTAGGQVVRKDKFREFVSEYKKIQDESPLTSALNVEFEIHVHIRETDKESGTIVEKTKKNGFRLRPCMVVSAVSNCILKMRLLI